MNIFSDNQLKEIIAIAKAKLRSDFDNEKVDLLSIDFIAEALRLGFKDLAIEMHKDLASGASFFDTYQENYNYITKRVYSLMTRDEDTYSQLKDYDAAIIFTSPKIEGE